MATASKASTKRSVTSTAIFKKVVMAVSGLIFVFYVIAHMVGNLKLLQGAEHFDGYAHALRTLGEPILPYSGFLWIFRLVLIAALIAHVWAAFTLWARANAARPTRYAVKKAAKGTLASRTMRWGGVALLLFVVFHLLHFTAKVVPPAGDHKASPYDMVVASFQNPLLVLVYLLAMVALGLHLWHGAWSVTQTLGLSSQRNEKAIKTAATALAALVVVGFIIPPLAVLFGMVG